MNPEMLIKVLYEYFAQIEFSNIIQAGLELNGFTIKNLIGSFVQYTQ